MNIIFRHILTLLTIALIGFVSSLGLAQGPLDPVAPPAPAYRTLDEVNPRKMIKASDLPLVINQAGSYYLTESIYVSTPDMDAIGVDADNVTIDLMGHALIGPGKAVGTVGRGIISLNPRKAITVVNGTVSGWRLDGVNLQSVTGGCRVENLIANDNGQTGIAGGDGSVVKSCTASSNAADGISVKSGASISDCEAKNNGRRGFLAEAQGAISLCSGSGNGEQGLLAGNHCVITASTFTNNTLEGIASIKTIPQASGLTVSDCTASGNGGHGISLANGGAVMNCNANANVGHGIAVSNGITVTNSSALSNTLNGINATDHCLVKACSSSGNTLAGVSLSNYCVVADSAISANLANGIEVLVGGCRLESNQCTANGGPAGIVLRAIGSSGRNYIAHNSMTSNNMGLKLEAATTGLNFIIGNVAGQNPSGNYDFGGLTNTVGPIITGTGTIATTSPWANFDY